MYFKTFWRYKLPFLFAIILEVLVSTPGKLSCQVNARDYKKFYYPNGVISSEGFFKNGKPDGFWKTYYVNGVLKSEGLWRNSVLDSTWKFFDNLGNVTSIINYYAGKKSGFYYTYKTVNGRGSNRPILVSKELYLNDQREDFGYYYRNDGSIATITHFVDGKKDGTEKEFKHDSTVSTILEYSKGRLIYYDEVNRVDSAGKPYGVWKDFFPNGRIKLERTYLKGLLNGYVKSYNEKGELISAILYKNDTILRDSVSNNEVIYREIVDSIANTIEKGTFLGSIRLGNHYFLKNGKLDSCLVYNSLGQVESKGLLDANGLKIGIWYNYFSGTRIIKSYGKYSKSLPAGSWIYYYRNGSIEQKGSFTNGKISGSWEWFYANGELKKFEEYLNGLRDGLYYELADNSDTLVAGTYISGLKDGLWKIVDGDLLEKGKFVSGSKDGEWRYYYPSKKLYFKGNFNQGIADGQHQFFYPNGRLMEEQFYSSGFPIGLWRKFSEDGLVTITIQYKGGVAYKVNGYRVEE